MDLFDDAVQPAVEKAEGVTEYPDTLEHRIDIFLNRWSWRTNQDTVRRELDELITFARSQRRDA